jgi:hypothetical protein
MDTTDKSFEFTPTLKTGEEKNSIYPAQDVNVHKFGNVFLSIVARQVRVCVSKFVGECDVRNIEEQFEDAK